MFGSFESAIHSSYFQVSLQQGGFYLQFYTPASAHTLLSQLLGFFGGDCILRRIYKLFHTLESHIMITETTRADTVFQIITAYLLRN